MDYEEYDETDVYVYENYSGRGMYGETTTGIVVPSLVELTRYTIMYSRELYENFGDQYNDLPDLSMDSLGRSYIVY